MRWLIALLLVGMCSMGGNSAGSTPADGRVAHLMPEVRLRKIHLVRPDLIPFPLNYEVYC